ncbi:MAG TPA: BlaI/MecI/CopY family transcriptional regulator, partial [Gammaproteobacteria bacterium]|nr:BlaI/MecI/CopY family transcriptional regulator [Gammaproteobacteria bacterium]
MPQRRIKVTDLELLILQQIWEAEQPLTVGAIIERWPLATKPGYTTVLKTLQKMEAKAIAGHREDGKRYAYFAKVD